MLKIHKLHTDIGKFSLSNVSFKVEKNSIHTIAGFTGSGKTLLMESILGLVKITSGKIFIDNIDISNLPTERRSISYVPQDFALFPHLNVIENIKYFTKVNSSKSFDQRLFDHLVEVADIGNLLTRKTGNLSGGEKQRVALIRALMPKNKLLILDEPFSAVNDSTKENLLTTLKQIHNELDITTILVSHDLNDSFSLSDTISIIEKGEILETDTIDNLFFRPQKIKVAKFVGIKNFFSATIKTINNSKLHIYLKDVDQEVHLNTDKGNSYNISDNICIGIRKEHIRLISHEDKVGSTSNILMYGEIISFIRKIDSINVLIKLNTTGKIVHTNISYDLYHKLDRSSDRLVSLSIDCDNFFILED